MSLLCIVLLALFFTLMGLAYCAGWSHIKRTMPEYLVHYYLVAAAVRFIVVAVVIIAYIKLAEATKAGNIQFALTAAGMYVAMMIVTLTINEKRKSKNEK